MGGKRRHARRLNLWHQGFAYLLGERAPPHIEVLTEVELLLRPSRADLLLLRRQGVARQDHKASVLRGLWPLIGDTALVEFKGPTREFRATDLLRLVCYGTQYLLKHYEKFASPAELSLVLIAPDRNAALNREIAWFGWEWESLGNGYARLANSEYTIFVICTDEVAEAERDEYLRIFSHHDVNSSKALFWWKQWFGEGIDMPDVKDMEDYDEVMRKFLRSLAPEQLLDALEPEQLLDALEPEQLLTVLEPEQRLDGLAPEQIAEYLRALPKEQRDLIRKHLDDS